MKDVTVLKYHNYFLHLSSEALLTTLFSCPGIKLSSGKLQPLVGSPHLAESFIRHGIAPSTDSFRRASPPSAQTDEQVQ